MGKEEWVLKQKVDIKKIIILQTIVFIYSIGSVLSKVASNQMKIHGIFSFQFIGLLFCMIMILAFYALFWQKLLKTTDLTIAYANKGMVLFWSLLWSILLFHETVTIYNVIGIAFIIAGILVVTAND